MMYSLSDEEDDEFIVMILKSETIREYCLNIIDQTQRFSEFCAS